MTWLVIGAALAVALGTAVALLLNDEDPDAMRRRIEADPVGYVGWLVPPVVVAMGAASAVVAGRLGWLVGIGVAAVTTASIEPWWVARAVAIPRGWTRAAYALTRVSTWTWRDDRRGGALFAGALAAARRPTRDEAAERWLLADELPAAAAVRLGEPPITGVTVVAYGLLAASSGDRDRARALLSAAARWFDLPAEASRAAWRWLAGDAAARGAWDEVVEAGRRSEGPEGAALAGAAQRLLGLRDAPDQAALIELTRGAPAMVPIVTRALDAEWSSGPPVDWAPAPDDPLLAALAGLERAPAVVTLVGPGGVGKSRLARRVVGASPVGVWAWAALDGPVDADGVATAVAAALGLPASVQGTEGLLVAARDAPAAGVVLDRAEVALDGAARLAARWARALPDRPWIVTSRTPLGIGAETCVTVAPLAGDDAVALLLHRAKAWLGGRDWAAPDDPAVRELVRRLDGLPLALELAAARAVVLGPEELCQRLHDPAVLTASVRDAEPRHSSLDRMLEASWSALSDPERQALAALTVFHGPFPLEAAERVAGSFAVVDALVRNNLLRPRSAGGRLANYDTVRTFVARRGDIAGRAEVDRRYARCAVLDGVASRDRLVAARLGVRLGELAPEAAVEVVLRAEPVPHDPPLTVAELLAFASELATAHPGCVRAVVAGADIATRQSDRAQVDAWLDRLDDVVRRAELAGPSRRGSPSPGPGWRPPPAGRLRRRTACGRGSVTRPRASSPPSPSLGRCLGSGPPTRPLRGSSRCWSGPCAALHLHRSTCRRASS